MPGIGQDIIRGPVGMVIGLVVWLVVFPLLIGAINGWYLQSQDACVVGSERFDRVVVMGANEVEDAWQGVTGTATANFAVTRAADLSNSQPTLSAAATYLLTANSEGCRLQSQVSVTGATDITTPAPARTDTVYTPRGTEVSAVFSAISGADDTAQTLPITISGGEWEEESGVFNSGGLSGLIEIVLQAAGLAPPVALMFALGTFGTSFMRNITNHPILAAILTVVMMLLVATLLNTFVPFLTDAFEAIDGNRFLMYDEGLGTVSTIVGDFFGVVIVASMMTVAWQVLKYLRGRNTLTSQSM